MRTLISTNKGIRDRAARRAKIEKMTSTAQEDGIHTRQGIATKHIKVDGKAQAKMDAITREWRAQRLGIVRK